MSKVSGLRTFSSPSDDIQVLWRLETTSYDCLHSAKATPLSDDIQQGRSATLPKRTFLPPSTLGGLVGYYRTKIIVAIKQKLKGGKKLRFGKVERLDLSKAQLLASLYLLLDGNDDFCPPRGRSTPHLGPKSWSFAQFQGDPEIPSTRICYIGFCKMVESLI